MNCQICEFPTELDWMAVCWTGKHRLVAASFARPAAHTVLAVTQRSMPVGWNVERVSRAETPDPIAELIERLEQFAAGEGLGDFRDVPLELGDRTPFQRQVLTKCQAVPPGETVSYGELARRAGSPRAARAVGSVMRHNRVPLIVPCHRVIGSDGSLHGFSSPQGLRMKRRLLDLEQTGPHVV